MTVKRNTTGRRGPGRSLEDRLRRLQPPVPPTLEAKLLAGIPPHKAIADTGGRRPAMWMWAAAGSLAAAAIVLVVVLTHLGNRPAASDSHTVTAVATDKDMESAICREGAAARLLASTRILAGQAGTEKYVSRTLAYIAQEYPNTIAAREIAASHKKQGDER